MHSLWRSQSWADVPGCERGQTRFLERVPAQADFGCLDIAGLSCSTLRLNRSARSCCGAVCVLLVAARQTVALCANRALNYAVVVARIRVVRDLRDHSLRSESKCRQSHRGRSATTAQMAIQHSHHPNVARVGCCCVVSGPVMSCHVTSCRVVPRCVVARRVASSHVVDKSR